MIRKSAYRLSEGSCSNDSKAKRRGTLAARPFPSVDQIDDGHSRGAVGDDDVAPVMAEPMASAPRPAPSQQSLRGLDWFIFFLADVQTGFGPFIAVYLTTQKWTQVEIGLVLSVGGIVALLGQMPGGAIIDAARSERLVAGLAVATIAFAALCYAAWPIFPVVAIAATLHAAARSEEHTSELQSRPHLVCRLLLEKKKTIQLRDKSHKQKNKMTNY